MVLTFDSGDVLEHPQLNNMIRALDGDGVVSGFAVTQRSASANMSVDVALGTAMIAGAKESESGITNLVIEAANATKERKDLITYDASGDIPAVIKGTDHAGTTADPTYPPDIPTGDILLAIVKVNAAVTSIVNGDITDGRAIVPEKYTHLLVSDDLQKSDDGIDALGTAGYAKIKEITVPSNVDSGAIRISFAMNRLSGTSYGKIYKNGVAVGTERTTGSATYTTYSEDFGEIDGGDTIELWGYSVVGAGNVKEFRIYCDQLFTEVASVSW
jgi:hypothetical protein